MNHLSGVYTIMPTPFRMDGSLDQESLITLTRFLVSLGVDGLVVLGVLGEVHKLSRSECDAVITAVVDAAAGEVPVFAGCSAGGTDLAAASCLRAAELGASGFLVAPPPVQNDDVLWTYYSRINAAVDLPIILQDYPAATGILMNTQLVVRLHQELEHVRCIKLEEAPPAPKISSLRALAPEMTILGGLGGVYFIEELDRGSDGTMTGFSYPDVLKQIYRMYTGGDKQAARERFYSMCPLLRYEFQPGIGLAVRKEVYRKRGAIQSSYVRHPGAQLDEMLSRELDRVLLYCGITSGG